MFSEPPSEYVAENWAQWRVSQARSAATANSVAKAAAASAKRGNSVATPSAAIAMAAECGYPCNDGRPCCCPAPCKVHTDAFKQRKERERMDRADAQSRARQREELPQCGWTTKSRQRCTHPMPCPFHATARKKAAEAEAAAGRKRAHDAAVKCGQSCRDGSACTRAVPCEVHGTIAGMKDCSSSLDGDPFDRCRKKVKVGELFCECHQPFPDLGRRAGTFGEACRQRGEKPTMQLFLAQHYPGHEGSPPGVHDFAKYCESMRQKFAA